MTYIIAEVGVNHNNKLSYAYKYIDFAKKIGVDAIKFQIFKTENYVTKKSPLAKYQKQNTNNDNQFDLIKKLELSEDKINKIISYCKKKKIEFIASIFDEWALKFLIKKKLKKIKIPSGEINNFPLLEKISKTNKEIILSTGMSTMSEVKSAFAILSKRKRKIHLLHCHSYYPSKINDLNLNAIKTLKKRFKCSVGFSDHSLGYLASIAAVAIGAQIIEKHITLDKKLVGPDHKASLNLKEFKNLVKFIRLTEKSLGNGIKMPTKKEKEIMKVARKSIVAKKSIKKNNYFTKYNITTKRPGTGIPPTLFKKLLTKKAKKNYKKDQMI